MVSKCILLVEDNPNDEVLTIRAFQKNKIDCQIITAHDGIEALDYLFGSKAGGPPCLILLDLKLPKVDGFEVLRRVRASEVTKFVPVIVLSTSLEPRDLLRSYELGANSYIRKSVDFGRFNEIVRIVSMYWFDLNQSPTNMPAGHV